MPWARAASTQVESHDTIGARPGTNRARVSLARSLVPMTKPASRVSESCASAASAAMLKIACRRLDHRPDPGLQIGLHVEQALADPFELRHLRDLRDQDGVRPGMRRGIEIVGMPRRVDAVDPDEHLARAEAAGLHRLDDLMARLLLGLGRDRVLEIEDHAVDRQRARLLDRARV